MGTHNCGACWVLLWESRAAAWVQVPDEAVLLAETGSLIEHIVEIDITEESELALQSVPLIITAMYEKMRGAGSQWSAYLSFLPQLHQMSLPFTWEVSGCEPMELHQ